LDEPEQREVLTPQLEDEDENPFEIIDTTF